MLKEKSINLTIICWPQNVNLTQTTVWYCFVGIWLDYNYTVLSFFLSLPPPGGTLTNEEVPNSLYQPITMLERSRSSSMIWATPMNTFLPSTLQHTSLSTKVVLWRHQTFKTDQEVQVSEVLYFFTFRNLPTQWSAGRSLRIVHEREVVVGTVGPGFSWRARS